MKKEITFKGVVERFPGQAGWHYIPVPEKYTKFLNLQRRKWGMFPISASIKKTKWKTKLMVKKGGAFFIALKSDIRKKENISLKDKINISFILN